MGSYVARGRVQGVGEQVMPNSMLGREELKVCKLCRAFW
jgi:hypothetical protein